MGALLLAVTLALAAPGDTWPAFRGSGASVSEAVDLPLKWSRDENIAWTAALPGYGQSSPVVWGKHIFVTSAVGNEKELAVVICCDLASGRELWRKNFESSVPARVNGYISRAAPTPAVDAERVYAFFEVGNLLALDHDGELIWQRSLTDDYGKFLGNHGLGSSLAVTDDAVFVLVDHDGPSYLLAVDKSNGKTLWKSDRPKNVSWTSPIVAVRDGKPQLIVSSSGTCEAIDAATGKRIWSVDEIEGNTVPSATVSQDLIVVGSSQAGANMAVRRGGKGNVTETHVAWRNREATATFSSPLVYDGHVYLVNRVGVAFCVNEETGKTEWTHRIGQSCWASPMGTGNRVYFFGKEGQTTVVATGPELKVLAENNLPARGRVYGVAAVDGKFVVRNGSRLICIGAPSNSEGDKNVNESTQDKQADRPRWPNLPHAITSFGAAILDGSLYVYGGHHGKAHHYSQAGQSGDLLRLSLETPEKWQVVARGPKLQGLAMVAHNDKLYRMGGFTARNKEDDEQDLWSAADSAVFDPANAKDQWQELPAMPVPRSSFDAAVIGDTIYVVGGWSMQGDKETEWLDSACAVDLSEEPLVWKPLPKPPFQRRALSVGGLAGKLYVIGGMQPDGEVTTRTAVYDPKTAKWTEGPQLPGDKMEGFGSACFGTLAGLYVTTASGKVLRLSDDVREWQIVGKLSAGRFFHRMLPIADRRFAILGGASMETGRFSEVEYLDIQP